MAETVERDDVQGLVVRGYGDLRSARFLLGEVIRPEPARAWLGTLVGRIGSGTSRGAASAVNVALTAAGLAALGLPREVLAGFAEPFLEGMTADHRRRALGDEGDRAPERWQWGGPAGPEVHVLLLVYARDDAALAAVAGGHEEDMVSGGMRVITALETAALEEHDHFGFRDGISQPRLAGLGPAAPADSIATGELLLGYRNAYGRHTPRPLISPEGDPRAVLPDDREGSGHRDLGRNGTYIVLRQLSQDVGAFWDFCSDATRRLDGTADDAARVRLAAKLVGRWPSGASLVLAPDVDHPELAEENDFGYHHPDRHGLSCPFGAHVRRANPRDSLDPAPGTARSTAVNNRHRLLRRGRQYGAFVPREQLLAAGGSQSWPPGDRGLHFIGLAGNITRQFEFLQRTWLENPRFHGLYRDPDPLLGGHKPDDRSFTVQAAPIRRRYASLPSFVTVRGGAYFFLPGMRALRYLASLPASDSGGSRSLESIHGTHPAASPGG